MTKQVQLVGGTRESQDFFTGEDREVTVDMSNWELRLHDGTTAGGHRILNLNQLLQLFQGKSDELSGFDFDPQGVGFLTRLAPQDYRLRSLGVDVSGLAITFGNGVGGNPSISLNSTIQGVRTFPDGIVGDLVGDTAGQHVGPVIGNTTGLHIGNVTGNAAGNHTGSMTGDVDIRGETFQADPGQIPITFLNQAALLSYVRANAFLPGMGMMWFGTVETIPVGWLLCDGTNGTPNMNGVFPRGTTSNALVGTGGGADAHAHGVTLDSGGAHSHAVTVNGHALSVAEMPTHKHGNGVTDAGTALFNHGILPASPTTGDSIDNNGSTGVNEGYTTEVGSGTAHSHTANTDASGAHAHTGTVDSSSNIPAHRYWIYIMKGA